MNDILDKLTRRERGLLEALAAWNGPEVPSFNALAPLSDYADESGVRLALKRLAARDLVTLHAIRPNLTVPSLTPATARALGANWGESPTPVEMLPGGATLIAHPISCGGFREANPESGIEVCSPRDLFSHWITDRDDLLRAEGDSMADPYSDDSIEAGDWVQYRANICPANGDTVYVEFEVCEGERVCQLKRFHLDKYTGIVTLTPANPEFAPVQVPGERVTVLGVVIETLSRRNQRGKGRK